MVEDFYLFWPKIQRSTVFSSRLRLKMWVEFWSELSFSCLRHYVSYLFPVLFKLPHFWGLKIENQILFSTGQYPYKDHATFSSVLSTTILEYKTRTHCNHLDKSFIMEKTSLDRVSELAVKNIWFLGRPMIHVITDQNSCYIVTYILEIFSKKGDANVSHIPPSRWLWNSSICNGSHFMDQESIKKVDDFLCSGRCLHLWC